MASAELFVWRIAGKANRSVPTENYVVQGILPLLRFMLQRDADFYKKIVEASWSHVCVSGELQYSLPAYHANVLIKTTSDYEDDNIDPDQYNDWACWHCMRLIGNMYFSCTECYQGKKKNLCIFGESMDHHYICCDCFFAGRHFPGEHNSQHDFSNPVTNYSVKKLPSKPYQLRFRLFVSCGARAPQKNLVHHCVEHLDSHDMTELPATEATLKYLAAHPAVVAIESKYLPTTTPKSCKRHNRS